MPPLDRRSLLLRCTTAAAALALPAHRTHAATSVVYGYSAVSDYATARMRISVPAAVDCVASGELEAGFPAILAAKDSTQNRKIYVFTAAKPLRYLTFIMSRFARAETSFCRSS